VGLKVSIENFTGKSFSSVSPGALYLVATPIGNLADITQRAVSVLEQVDIIAAEDTRHSQRLLSHFAIKTKMLAYHEHNEEQMTARLLDKLVSGKSIALISDAGTPLISDPGYRLVAQAHENSMHIVPVPGACAAIAALSSAGLANNSFIFEGFPPAKQGARLRFFESLSVQHRTMIFYVSCHRIIDTLNDMQTIFGESRRITFARELTKTFETIKRTELSALIKWVEADDNQRKGEIVLVLEGKVDNADKSDQVDHYLSILLTELPVKQSVKLVVKMTGEHKNDVYRRALELTKQV
jgi:16S rRNA (cytidine1402-2'-O)-methyltransferase